MPTNDHCRYHNGSCRQLVWRDGKCRYHWHSRWVGFQHDHYYHQKIMAALLDPTWGYLTNHELSAMFSLRAHRDGRTSDVYRRGIVDDAEERF